jgi:Na+/H+-dicarboxylate symporter
MVDLVGFLTSPRVFLGGLIGLLVGLGAAYLLHLSLWPQAAIELLAMVVALGIFVGILLGARTGSRD